MASPKKANCLPVRWYTCLQIVLQLPPPPLQHPRSVCTLDVGCQDLILYLTLDEDRRVSLLAIEGDR
eukprot:396286-Rhodomonas_salina.1